MMRVDSNKKELILHFHLLLSSQFLDKEPGSQLMDLHPALTVGERPWTLQGPGVWGWQKGAGGDYMNL